MAEGCRAAAQAQSVEPGEAGSWSRERLSRNRNVKVDLDFAAFLLLHFLCKSGDGMWIKYQIVISSLNNLKGAISFFPIPEGLAIRPEYLNAV